MQILQTGVHILHVIWAPLQTTTSNLAAHSGKNLTLNASFLAKFDKFLTCPGSAGHSSP